MLTEHFHLSEFTRSATAERLHLDNTPPQEAIYNLRLLCENVLEPLRRYIGKPVIISSGYRSKELNRRVGGARHSQHMTGEAADIQGNLADLQEWKSWIIDNLRFDQLIIEHRKNRNGTVTHWLHVSFSSRHNRQCVIANIWKK